MKTIHDISNTSPNTGRWKERHNYQVSAALHGRDESPGGAVVLALNAWCNYAAAHAKRYQSPIGEDYVLGPAWARWGTALRELLNGDCGSLDCGTLDSIILDNLCEQGFDPDGAREAA